MFELGRVEVIVFDGVSRSVNIGISQSRNLVKCIQLDIHRHARRKTVQIHLIRIFAFRFQEERMLILVGEGDELGFDARTVTWAGTLNLTII